MECMFVYFKKKKQNFDLMSSRVFSRGLDRILEFGKLFTNLE